MFYKVRNSSIITYGDVVQHSLAQVAGQLHILPAEHSQSVGAEVGPEFAAGLVRSAEVAGCDVRPVSQWEVSVVKHIQLEAGITWAGGWRESLKPPLRKSVTSVAKNCHDIHTGSLFHSWWP